MYRLVIHDDANADLDQLWIDNPLAAALVLATLQECQADQRLLDSLLVHDYGKDRSEEIHVSKWLQLYRQGKDLWRLKVWELEDQGVMYRIIYAYIPGKRVFHVLA